MLPEELARDDLTLDLGRTFVDARAAYLAVQMLQEVSALEGTGATHLDSSSWTRHRSWLWTTSYRPERTARCA